MSGMEAQAAVRGRRLRSLGLAGPAARDPREPPRLLGGIQAQDHEGARWSIGLRTQGCSDADVEAALAAGRVVRTWAFRGTLHLLAAEDVRWVTALLAPAIVASNRRRYRQLGLDERDFEKSRGIIGSALSGSPGLTRADLASALEGAGLSPGGQRAPYLLQRAALDGLICEGPHHGREPVYVLLDSRVPRDERAPSGEAALAELARRYFAGHGPASLKDFAWWSGLPAADARRGLESAGSSMERVDVSGVEMWVSPASSRRGESAPALLLPPFDELLLGYRDRELWLEPRHARAVNAGGGMPRPTVLLGGRVAGTWTRKAGAKHLQVAVLPFGALGRPQIDAIQDAAARLAAFLGAEAGPVAVAQP